jgi:hypothetical protein
MIFEPDLRVPIPNTDILTYIFANPSYDPNKPVRLPPHFGDLSRCV